jgi:hypothetical protein
MLRRKLGLMIATMTQRTIRRMKIPSSFFISALSFVINATKRHKKHKGGAG